MSVFTRVDSAELAAFLNRYDIGDAIAFEPIEAGVTNSNYRLDTSGGAYILTLYEHHSAAELDYILGLQQHLARNGVRCARPIADRGRQLYGELNHRPAAIIERLPGSVVPNPDESHCAAIGRELAGFHLAGMTYSGRRDNPRGLTWIRSMREMLVDTLGPADRSLIDSSIERLQSVDIDALPGGAIHADLFHDNAMFEAGKLGGIFDFDYACNDSFCFDIAVLLNDWARDDDGELVPTRIGATLDAYRQKRELAPAELTALPVMLAFTALRFWLSRLHDLTFPLTGAMVLVKPPEEYRRILALRLAHAEQLFADAKAGKDFPQ